MAYKCLFAIVFLACQVHTQASVEVQSGTLLLVTLDQIQQGNQTGVSSGNDATGSCQRIEVTATSNCNGRNSGHNVKISIPNSTPSHATCPEPQCPQPQCPAAKCPQPQCPEPQCPQPQCPAAKCPQPQCPAAKCPQPQCPEPRCPSYPACTSCPTPAPPCSTCPACPTPAPPPARTCPPPPPSTTTPSPPALLQGYEHIQGLGCYKYHITPIPWTRAKQTCESEGSHLLILNSEAESQAIVKILQRDAAQVTGGNSGYSWLGLVESNTTQHEFYTVFGDPLASTGFTRWQPGQPDDTSLGDNVFLYSPNGNLYDHPGTTPIPFACEQFTC